MGETKTVSCFLFLFLFVFLLFYGVNSVNALVINSDGTVDSPKYVNQNGDVYVVTADVGSLTVNRDNIIVDGDWHKLDAGADSAVRMINVQNVTLKNFIITRGAQCPLQVGIVLQYSSNCTISGNTISRTEHVNPKFWSTSGICISGGGSHTISENNITNNCVGILLGSSVSPNTVVENSITNCSTGISITGSSSNLIYGNNFVHNSKDIFDMGTSYPDVTSSSINIWDNGITGNYWSNYMGQDINGDNVGDSPHTIFENNQDNYPLMTPIDIEVIPEFPSLVILPLFLTTTLLLTICRKRLKKLKIIF
ncbi:MAG: right-handed parallel beta-helix repeat-containing protein [Candidatus Bathyarchaeota archaeon]|nr:right-handed parallel beta-helix repeat-containing protein [Candidatus Bathyarchaeum sp.]